MADQTGELRRIHWDECFAFTRIFKSFRMAIQPGKLGLALAGVILMGIWGSLLDGLWPASVQPVGAETWAYWQVPQVDTWREAQKIRRTEMLRDLYGPGGLLKGAAAPSADTLASPAAIARAQDQLEERYAGEIAKLDDKPQAIASVAERYRAAHESLGQFRTRGVFRSFLKYEQEAVGHLLGEARSLLLLDGWALARDTDTVISAKYRTHQLRAVADFGDIGMVGTTLLMYRGVQWLIGEHPLFAILFLFGSLAIWSVFGGAICRMAALNAARDEQISMRTAVQFAVRKFFGFFSAPLLPVIMILMVGATLFLGGLFPLSVPYVGEILGGILMVLALVGGFVVTLIMVGAVGGGALLWPTVAVEGSDGFDAMSRGYSYFYSRPWRTVVYSIVAAIYGGVTYAALRYFVYLVLRVTRAFVGAGTWLTSRPGTGVPGANKLDAMWPIPTPDNLVGDWSCMLGLMRWEGLGAVFIHLWVLLLVLVLCAYLVSFYFSAGTVIYTLLRHKVDATDFDDVYLEEDEESAMPGAAASAIAAAPASRTTPRASATPPGTSPD